MMNNFLLGILRDGTIVVDNAAGHAAGYLVKAPSNIFERHVEDSMYSTGSCETKTTTEIQINPSSLSSIQALDKNGENIAITSSLAELFGTTTRKIDFAPRKPNHSRED
jgi:hypothetical protein